MFFLLLTGACTHAPDHPHIQPAQISAPDTVAISVPDTVADISSDTSSHHLPEGFAYVRDSIPGIAEDIRYCSENNFIGDTIDGYMAPRAILTNEAIHALKAVQTELNGNGYGLKIFDAYRPQRAADHFVRWSKDMQDQRMKAAYYPDIQKISLFRKGYIADSSGHTRGSAIDLTLIYQDGAHAGEETDMGCSFDHFGPIAGNSAVITSRQKDHRQLLKETMEKHGFIAYRGEWWHFLLKNEPHPNTYFDFSVE